ncbi:MAG TPA: helix-turn-helix transcriptional regulator, partial [Micropruina sp.]|nr:helix-turn-helix transcriptional regulator [Micropruina sp.]
LDTLLGAWSRLSALGYRLDAARLGCVVAAAGLRWGQRRRIRSTVEDAVTTLTQQRVAGWRELAGELLDRVTGTAAAPELTTTEAQIAELVAAGRRNREIGGELFVSESTVESHLTRIYRKLGLRNRAELVHALRPAAG